jgi:diadenosine tetraphosphate (Ap4A) HIT family hydrolase
MHRLAAIGRRLSSNTRIMSEQEKALHAQPPPDEEETLFDKIAKKQIPANIVYEDETAIAFRDISPQAPTHIVIIPKSRDGLSMLSRADTRHEPLLGHLMWVAAEVARRENLEEGWRLVVNNGRNACQSVFHLHLHLLGGRMFNWPPG